MGISYIIIKIYNKQLQVDGHKNSIDWIVKRDYQWVKPVKFWIMKRINFNKLVNHNEVKVDVEIKMYIKQELMLFFRILYLPPIFLTKIEEMRYKVFSVSKMKNYILKILKQVWKNLIHQLLARKIILLNHMNQLHKLSYRQNSEKAKK